MDYVLKGQPKPALLKNNINYEVMGANVWRHTTSLGAVHGGVPMRLYFSSQKNEGLLSLVNQQPPCGSDCHQRGGLQRPQGEVPQFPLLPIPYRAGTVVVRHRECFPEPAVRSGDGDQRFVHGRACRDHQQERLRLRRHGVRGHAGWKAVPPGICAYNVRVTPRTPPTGSCSSRASFRAREIRNHHGEPADAAGLEIVSAGGCDQESIGAGELRHRQRRE